MSTKELNFESSLKNYQGHQSLMEENNKGNLSYEEVITAQGSFSLNLKELWNFRELIFIFGWRDIKVKYKQTSLGIVWAIIQPLAMAVIFTLTVGRLIPQTLQIAIPYPVFVYSGLIHWYLFSSALQSCSSSMFNNENIIKKIYFPRLVIPLANIMVSCFDFIITFILYVILLFIYSPDINWLYFIAFTSLSLLLNVITVFGFGTFLAALTIKYRDFRYTIPFMIQFFMFVSPIFYPAHIVKNHFLSFLMQLNPFNAVLELTRAVFPDSTIDAQALALGCMTSILSFVIGLVYFRRTESYFADLA